MEVAVMHFIIVGVISGLTKGDSVLPDGPQVAAVGGAVKFTPTLTPPATSLVLVDWKFGEKVIVSSNAPDSTPPEYRDRFTLNMSTGSLVLRNLALNDSGEYRVFIVPDGKPSKEGSTRLEVYVPVSNVTAIVSSTDFVEFNSSVSLSCSSSGSSLSYHWINGSSEVAASDRAQLTDGGSNLTILNVTRYDEGPFTCHVSNPISNGASDPISLTISYGPENVQIAGPREIEEKQSLTLNCSAESAPPASYTWILNGTEIHNSAVFVKNLTEFSDSGNYTCQAMNNVTGRTSSVVHGLTVKERAAEGLSAGAIAGITISTCLVVAGAAAGGFYLYKKK